MTKVQTPIDSSAEQAGLDQHLEAIARRLAPQRDWTDARAWQQWRKKLAKGGSPPLNELLKAKKSNPLLWGLPRQLAESDLPELTGQLQKAAAGKKKALAWAAEALPNWLAEADGRPPSLAFSLECLAWAQAAWQLAFSLEMHPWLELLASLNTIGEEASALDLEAEPLLHELFLGEMAITLGYQFPQCKSLQDEAQQARKRMAAGLLDLLDGEGMPQADHLSQLRPLIGCWCRCGAMTRQLGDKLLIDDTDDAFCWAVQQMIRLTRGDRSQLLDQQQHSLDKEFLKAAIRLTDDPECRAAAKLGGLLGKKEASKRDHLEAPQAGAESEWAEVAVLRSDWSRRAASLVAVHSTPEIQLELSLGSQVLASGMTTPHVEIDSKVHRPTGTWEQVCWQADDDVDYLELEISLTGGWTLQRQLLLARDDCFLLHADAILCPEQQSEPHDISYRCALPLQPDWNFAPAEETTEGMLNDPQGKSRALVMPLALPEWRADRRVGTLRADDSNHLILAQQTRGTRLYAPLFFDLYSRRMRKQVTWRQLTIADQLQIQAADVAVGYRIQLGLEQWLIYRSLAAPRNRTVLGHNLITEFLVARFEDGEADPLLEIE